MNKNQYQQEYFKRINNAMNFISNNIHRDPSLEEISQAASFSKYHFHRIFKALTGETVASFSRRVKLQKAAKHLLFNTQLDITTIALECGFSSSQNFAKAFKKHYNLSPSTFRKFPDTNPFHRKTANTNKSKNGNTKSNTRNALLNTEPYHANNFIQQQRIELRNYCMNIQIKELQAQHVAYVRTYGLSDQTCSNAFKTLINWAKPRNLTSAQRIGLCWDNPDITPSEKCRFDACIVIPNNTKTDNRISEQTISGGTYAVGHYEITSSKEFSKCWDSMFISLSDSGYQPDDKPTYQIMHSTSQEHNLGHFNFDICIPIKPL